MTLLMILQKHVVNTTNIENEVLFVTFIELAAKAFVTAQTAGK